MRQVGRIAGSRYYYTEMAQNPDIGAFLGHNYLSLLYKIKAGTEGSWFVNLGTRDSFFDSANVTQDDKNRCELDYKVRLNLNMATDIMTIEKTPKREYLHLSR
jgi:hypothetical protein